jgi:hypothetical protein
LLQQTRLLEYLSNARFQLEIYYFSIILLRLTAVRMAIGTFQLLKAGVTGIDSLRLLYFSYQNQDAKKEHLSTRQLLIVLLPDIFALALAFCVCVCAC